MLRSLFPGLTDSQLSSASGTCVVLNGRSSVTGLPSNQILCIFCSPLTRCNQIGLIKARGKELANRVPELVAALTEEMGRITHEQTLNATLHAVRNLATHHTLPVIDQLLAVPVPHPTYAPFPILNTLTLANINLPVSWSNLFK